MPLEFKSNVTDLMDVSQISIRSLAEKTGLAVETISRARDERIASCKLETLIKIAAELRCHLTDLYSTTEFEQK